jgi:tRNA threonylcarbamoyladenosine biosynthesis protein TsaE
LAATCRPPAALHRRPAPAAAAAAGAAADTDSTPFLVADEAGTAEVAARLAASLVPGDVVHLVGALGAGKTTFVRHACEALGVVEPVTSPTFAVAHLYHGHDGQRIAHLDLYRSERVTLEELVDLDAYLQDDVVLFVEWPDRGEGMLPPATRVVTLVAAGEHERTIVVT